MSYLNLFPGPQVCGDDNVSHVHHEYDILCPSLSESDFVSDVVIVTLRAGLQDSPAVISGSSLPVDDSREERSEGFLLFVEINEESLDPRDRGRNSFDGLVIPVSIIDDDEGTLVYIIYLKNAINLTAVLYVCRL